MKVNADTLADSGSALIVIRMKTYSTSSTSRLKILRVEFRRRLGIFSWGAITGR
jgi:hypothetical protein